MEDDLGRRDGGKGHESARENICETCVRRERTWSRVRRESTGASCDGSVREAVGSRLEEEGKIGACSWCA